MADQREAVLNFVRSTGPVLPVQLSKFLNTNILFASAMLSELVANKKLKITFASIGGSPLYYIEGQEPLMDTRLATSLSGREKQAYELIKEHKVMREIDLEPWQRVAIKSLKDFVRPINVLVQNNNETFWKHHLVNDEEAKNKITEIMNNVYVEPTQELTNNASTLIQENIVEENKTLEEPKIIHETNNHQEHLIKEAVKNLREELLKEIKPEIKTQIIEDKPIKVKEEIKTEVVKKPEGKFYEQILELLNTNNAEIIKEELVKKEKEIDFIINLNTNFGKLKYYVKAKNKASINDSDISLAYSDGQLKKLPTILIVNGKVNKKALELVNTKYNGQLTIKEI
ncbi:MAG: hypothetical protein AABX19_01435 [Nanoarchaeota archaeon]